MVTYMFVYGKEFVLKKEITFLQNDCLIGLKKFFKSSVS